MTNQRGSIYKRQGAWAFHVKYRINGKDQQTKRQGFPSKAEAQRALTDFLSRLDAGRALNPAKTRFADYLEQWIDTYRRAGHTKATTTDTTEMIVKRYLIPRLGTHTLASIKPQVISSFYGDLLQGGRIHKSNAKPVGLAPKTVRNIGGVLHKALEDAVSWKLLPSNPATGVALPKWEQQDLNVWDDHDLARFLVFSQETQDPMYPLWRLMLLSGMRRGELLGLRWEDVDLVEGKIRIEQTRLESNGRQIVTSPKTKAGRRKIAIDTETVVALAHLKNAHDEAKETFKRWTSPYVATDLDGRPIHPRTLTRRFQSASKACGVPVIRLHDGRHTSITFMLQQGVPVHVVAGRVGHASPTTTLKTYVHFLPTADQQASEMIGGVLDGLMSRPMTHVEGS